MSASIPSSGLAGAVSRLRDARSLPEVERAMRAFAPATSIETSLLADVAELARARVLAAEDARRDVLTGVLNRRGFFEAAHARLAACPGPVAVAIVDVDGLKAINDSLGHDEGSRTLRAAADALQGAFAGADAVVGRLGGDEFGVLVLDRSDAGPLQRALDATVRGRAAMRDVARLELSTGWATGIAVDAADLDALLGAADGELYAGRRRRRQPGRFRVSRLAPAGRPPAARRRQVAAAG